MSEEKEKTEIYMFNITRNKLGKNGKSVNNWKKELYTGICENCKNNFNLQNLELDHQIPVCITGSLIEKENLRLFCRRCHNEKTRKDHIIINMLKRLSLFKNNLSFIYPKRLHEIYIYLYNLLEEGESNFSCWYNSSHGIDYEQILYKENRGDIHDRYS